MKTPLMMIINPAAGKGGFKRSLPDALRLLSDTGYAVSLFFTECRGHATELATQYAGAFPYLLVLGGDGTLAEAIAGLMPLAERPKVGYIPIGTANDVARTIGLPKNDILAGAQHFIGGTPHEFDEGRRDGGYFNYVAAFGAFTEVSYATPQNQKKLLGHLAYVLQGMAALPKLESYNTRVEYDDGVFEGRLVYGSMSNSTSVAGIVRLPEEMVCLGDGESELVLVKDPGSVVGFGEIVDSVLSQRFDSDKLLILHTKKAKFTFEKPVAWTRDGEAGGEYSEIELRNYKAPVEMIF